MGRFSPDQSKEFLRLGFKEAGVAPPEDAIEEAVQFFDGIPGWLVHFGISYLEGASMEDIREAAVIAIIGGAICVKDAGLCGY